MNVCVWLFVFPFDFLYILNSTCSSLLSLSITHLVCSNMCIACSSYDDDVINLEDHSDALSGKGEST